nr:unnamed protein product [Callosobruchus chinensis]
MKQCCLSSRTATGRDRNGAARRCASFSLFLSTLAGNCGAAAAPRGKQPQVCSGPKSPLMNYLY